jgi:putative FmdB family regulatory protein
MPFYEYQCKHCGHHLEAMQKIHDAPLKKCPECGKSTLQRLMSAPVFRLKGAGWYETDFKSDQDGKRNLADKPEAEPVKDDKKDGKDAKDTKEAAGKEPTGKEPAGKEAAGKEPTGKEAAGKEATAKQESKPAAKTADGPSDKPAAKSAASKPSSTTRNIKRSGSDRSTKAKSKKPGKRTVGRR